MNEIKGYSIQTYLNDNLSALTEKQLEEFITKFESICNSPLSKMIFRGDTNTNFRKQYRISSENTPPLDLAKYLFLIGEKGKHFWNGDPLPFEILGDNSDVIEHVWCKVSSILKDKEIKESLFSEEGKDSFMQQMGKMDETQKRMILDYYYSYVHTYRSEGSHFLSTSESFAVALKFLRNKTGIVMVGWVPASHCNEMMIDYEDVCQNRENIEKLGFPTFETLYPKQKEICLKCGLLPHFMIGFYIPKEKTFVVNPALFKNTYSMDETIKKGFDVDQSEFLEELKKTGYSKCYWYDKGIYKVIRN